MINGLAPCFQGAQAGEPVRTEAVRIRRSSFLQKYNKKNGWYVNWEKLVKNNEIYALVIEGTVDIQGLIAVSQGIVSQDTDLQALYVTWMCTNAFNDKRLSEDAECPGVGGHLFAIAARRSTDLGYDGYMYGIAPNKTLLEYFIKTYNTVVVPAMHPYQFVIDGLAAKELMEVYNFVWTDEEI